jgi:HD-GYP domain-containing protein (c-di-GMP phosphodiesterase class II)
LNEELFEKIQEDVSVNASLIKKTNLNESDFKTINRHPYLSYEITRSIVNQRKSVPITPEVLKEILQDDETFEKLKAYIAY